MKKISIVLISLLLVSSVMATDIFRLSGTISEPEETTGVISQDSDTGNSGSSSRGRSRSRNSADDDTPERDDIITDDLIEERIIEDSEEDTEIIVTPATNKKIIKNKGDVRVILGILISSLIVIAGLCVYFIKRGKR